MAKSFKNFRNRFDDDNEYDDAYDKKKKMRERQDERKRKQKSRFDELENDGDE